MKINGSAMLISADTKEEAMKIIESDVYYKNKVWDPKKVRGEPPRDLTLLNRHTRPSVGRSRTITPLQAVSFVALLTRIIDSSLPIQNSCAE